uniref:Uncharacterized protein n=1 Tax=Mustela putorius furo TaxID=9669 RepID=M3YF62_MUSPF
MGRRLSGSWDQGRAPPQGAGVRRAQRRGPTSCTSTLGSEGPRPRASGRTGLGRRGSRPPAPGTLQATCWAHFTVGSLAPSWRLSSVSAPCRFRICCCAAVLLGFFSLPLPFPPNLSQAPETGPVFPRHQEGWKLRAAT